MAVYGDCLRRRHPRLGLKNFVVKPGLLWQAAVHLVI